MINILTPFVKVLGRLAVKKRKRHKRLSCHYLEGVGGAFPGTGTADGAFKRYFQIGVCTHIAGGADSHADVTAGTEFFIDHYHAVFVDGQSIGGTYIHAGSALVAKT
jgi:hypothetical protein